MIRFALLVAIFVWSSLVGGCVHSSGVQPSGSAALTHDPTPSAPSSRPDENRCGSLSYDHINAVVRGSSSAIRACYERALQRVGSLDGEVVVRFVVDADGSVMRADAASSQISDPEFESCLLAVVGALHFDPPEGGGTVEVRYPFYFGH